jgi:hypothetical protein
MNKIGLYSSGTHVLIECGSFINAVGVRVIRLSAICGAIDVRSFLVTRTGQHAMHRDEDRLQQSHMQTVSSYGRCWV